MEQEDNFRKIEEELLNSIKKIQEINEACFDHFVSQLNPQYITKPDSEKEIIVLPMEGPILPIGLN